MYVEIKVNTKCMHIYKPNGTAKNAKHGDKNKENETKFHGIKSYCIFKGNKKIHRHFRMLWFSSINIATIRLLQSVREVSERCPKGVRMFSRAASVLGHPNIMYKHTGHN